MIISHKYRFIFIKTNKTAGTSIEIALSRFCGEDDVITPISPEDERLRKTVGYRGAQRYLAPLSAYRLKDIRALLRLKRKGRYYNHMPAREIKRLVGEQTWNDYYTFCFERHPYERLISLYYWRHKTEPRPSIAQFLQSGVPAVLKTKGFDLYTIDGEIAVDRVYLFENLEEELEHLRVRLQLPGKLELPHAKASHRQDKRSAHEILTEEERASIRSLFSQEIALFGYQDTVATSATVSSPAPLAPDRREAILTE